MSSRVQIHFVEAALLDLLATLSSSYGETVDVATMSKGDFNDDGELVMKRVAVRLYFSSLEPTSTRDTTRTTQERNQMWSVVCFHESVRSRAIERTNTFALVAAVEDALAGARLKLGDGSYTEPVLLQGVNQVVDANGPLDQCYAVSFVVSGIAVFSGVNSNFGAKR